MDRCLIEVERVFPNMYFPISEMQRPPVDSPHKGPVIICCLPEQAVKQMEEWPVFLDGIKLCNVTVVRLYWGCMEIMNHDKLFFISSESVCTKTENCHDANIVVTGGTGGSHYENLRCRH